VLGASAAVRLLALVAVLTVFAPQRAAAVLIASGDGTGNTTAPRDDPGWANVGVQTVGSLTAIYLGNGWVLTAGHVGIGTVRFRGVDYAPLPGSGHTLVFSGTTLSDLLLFRLVDETGLPSLPVRAAPPAANATVTLVGNGQGRGAATSYGGHAGFGWLASRTLRWGTNQVAERYLDARLGSVVTRAFSTTFDVPGGTTDEAQAVVGDSGGAVFLKNGATWELAGMLFAVDAYDGQPANTSLDGNSTYAADLSFYRSQIQAIVNVPACRDGLDDDLDGKTDWPDDPGCSSPDDVSERYACEDQLDDDGDGLIDYPLDPGCAAPTVDVENPPCQNGIDDDGDGLVDSADPQCSQPWMGSEKPVKGCGLLGPEAVLALVLLRWRARRR
jgi:hypothetical protein